MTSPALGPPLPRVEAVNASGPAPSQCRESGLFPLKPMPLTLGESLALTAGDRARLKRLINDAKWSLNFMHGEFARPAATASNNFGRVEKVSILQTEVQHHLENRCLEALSQRCAHPPR